MELVKQAFEELYPNKPFQYNAAVRYSGKFNPYNARIQLRNNQITFRLSREWNDVDPDIVKGLFQFLFVKLFRGKQSTFSINLYHSFLKKVPVYTERKESDDYLTVSFGRVNERLFFGTMDQPTIVWGQESTRTLAHYNLHTDTIVVSTIFKHAPVQLLDYVMYHEMLHKKHQFVARGTRNHFHTAEFRADERKFGNVAVLEKELTAFLRTRAWKPRKFKSLWDWF
ncbi:MAG TPA: hypothetical protein VJB66_04725 [Candidatus Nanoarchaeia archaeon]|nr:hypothetical protein [Candidatus Nanoarchaeia archaeon]